MQKKNEEMLGLRLFVIIVFNAINDPNKYAPLSPIKIFEFGKLNNKKISKIMIWPINKKENSIFALLRFIIVSMILIIIRFKDKRPLNPSIKFAPLITNRKQISVNIEENKWLLNKIFKKNKSILNIFIGKKYIKKKSKNIIMASLLNGLIFIFRSSKNPIKNIVKLINK